MRRVLANPRNVARDYVRSHLGRVAARNAICTPWTHRVDTRLARRLTLGRGAVRDVEFLVDAFNAANLLDRRWGAEYLLLVGISSQNPVVNRVPLLRVVGFGAANSGIATR